MITSKTIIKHLKDINKICNAYLDIISEDCLNAKINNRDIKNLFFCDIKSNMYFYHNYFHKDKEDITNASSNILFNFKSPFVSTIGKRLVENGVIVISKTNSDEFACGSYGTTSYFGKSLLKDKKLPGGSSSGAAVSARYFASDLGLNHVSIGTDTGGSSRLPAILTGGYLKGFKPTFGLIPMYGVIQYADTLDVIGIIGAKIDNIKYIFNIICGVDYNDNRTNNNLNKDIMEVNSSVKVSIMFKDFLNKETEHFIAISLKKANIKNINYVFIENESKFLQKIIIIYDILSSIEFFSNLNKFNIHSYGKKNINEVDSLYEHYYTRYDYLGSHAVTKIVQGAYVLSQNRNAYYSAIYERDYIRSELDIIMKDIDILILPGYISEEEPELKLFNIIGYPAITFSIFSDVEDPRNSIMVATKKNNDLFLLNFVKEIFEQEIQ